MKTITNIETATLEQLEDVIILNDEGLYNEVNEKKFLNNEYNEEELRNIITNWIIRENETE